MAFAFYASDAAASPVVNSKSDYTTKKMESNSNTYSKMKARLDSTKLTSEQVKTNVANMIKAGLNVVDPVYQNDDGGWAKTNTEYDLLEDSFARLYTKGYSTVDNGATHGHMKFYQELYVFQKKILHYLRDIRQSFQLLKKVSGKLQNICVTHRMTTEDGHSIILMV